MTRGRMPAAAWLAAMMALAAWPAPLAAQPAAVSGPAAARFEAGAGWLWTGDVDLGGSAATLTPNLGTSSPFTLFRATASFGAPRGLELRAGYRLLLWLLVGVEGQLAKGGLQVSIRSDAEDVSDTTFSGERLGQAVLAARVDLLIPPLGFRAARVTPHVMASAGGFRQWHDGRSLIDSGAILGAGGGLRVSLVERPRSRLSRVGVLAEVRVSRVRGGFHWGRDPRSGPVAVVECFTGWGKAPQP